MSVSATATVDDMKGKSYVSNCVALVHNTKINRIEVSVTAYSYIFSTLDSNVAGQEEAFVRVSIQFSEMPTCEKKK